MIDVINHSVGNMIEILPNIGPHQHARIINPAEAQHDNQQLDRRFDNQNYRERISINKPNPVDDRHINRIQQNQIVARNQHNLDLNQRPFQLNQNQNFAQPNRPVPRLPRYAF